MNDQPLPAILLDVVEEDGIKMFRLSDPDCFTVYVDPNFLPNCTSVTLIRDNIEIDSCTVADYGTHCPIACWESRTFPYPSHVRRYTSYWFVAVIADCDGIHIGDKIRLTFERDSYQTRPPRSPRTEMEKLCKANPAEAFHSYLEFLHCHAIPRTDPSTSP